MGRAQTTAVADLRPSHNQRCVVGAQSGFAQAVMARRAAKRQWQINAIPMIPARRGHLRRHGNVVGYAEMIEQVATSAEPPRDDGVGVGWHWQLACQCLCAHWKPHWRASRQCHPVQSSALWPVSDRATHVTEGPHPRMETSRSVKYLQVTIILSLRACEAISAPKYKLGNGARATYFGRPLFGSTSAEPPAKKVEQDGDCTKARNEPRGLSPSCGHALACLMDGQRPWRAHEYDYGLIRPGSVRVEGTVHALGDSLGTVPGGCLP